MEGWWVENGIHWEISVSTLRHSQMNASLWSHPIALQCFHTWKTTRIQSLLLLSECVKWNGLFAESVSGVIRLFVLMLFVCGGLLFIRTCVFYWLPAFRLRDLHLCGYQLQWRNIVECFLGSQRYKMLQCILCTETKVSLHVNYRFNKNCFFCLFSPTDQNQVQSLSLRTMMKMSCQAHPLNLRSRMSPRTASPCPGSLEWLEHHLSPHLSLKLLGLFY